MSPGCHVYATTLYLQRIGQYEEASPRKRLDPWTQDAPLPVLDRLQLSCIPWEQVIADIQKGDSPHGGALHEFYRLCKQFNAPRTVEM